jgi:glyoxylase-like metal-dependent hydrolase (beta-lactamase superfamily II)
MKHLILWLAASTVAITLAPAVAEEAAQPAVTVTPIKGPLYALMGRGGSVMASVGDDGVLLVDANYRETARVYDETIRALAGDDAVPRFVVNTHWHLDHTGGNQFFAERGSVIVAHENIRVRMSTRQDMKRRNRVIEPSPGPALPVVTYGDSVALHFNGDDIEVQHYPRGHTDGDSVVYFAAANVVHVGDLVFAKRFPFVDIDSGGNVFGAIDNIAEILARIDDRTVVVAGHGGITDKAGLAGYHRMLVTTSNQVKEALAAGRSVEEITAAGLGDEWDSWGTGFIDEAFWIRSIADSL